MILTEKKVIAIAAVFVIAMCGLVEAKYTLIVEDNKTFVGDEMVFEVTGSYNGITYEGISITKVTDAWYGDLEVKWDIDIDEDDGVTVKPFWTIHEYEWMSVEDYIYWGDRTGTETIDTKWGTKTVDVCVIDDGGVVTTNYVDLERNIAYRMVHEYSYGMVLTLDLVETTII